MKNWNKGEKVCSKCGSNKTYRRKNGYEQWNIKDGEYWCQKCYCKLIKYPKWKVKHIALYNPKRILFKQKRIILDEDPRKGICKMCGKKGLTHMHHYKYDDKDPLKYTIELCPSCHAKEGYKLKQLISIDKINKK